MSIRDRLIAKLETELKDKLESVMNELFKGLPVEMPIEDLMRCHIVLGAGLLGLIKNRVETLPPDIDTEGIQLLMLMLDTMLEETKTKLLSVELNKLHRKQSESN